MWGGLVLLYPLSGVWWFRLQVSSSATCRMPEFLPPWAMSEWWYMRCNARTTLLQVRWHEVFPNFFYCIVQWNPLKTSLHRKLLCCRSQNNLVPKLSHTINMYSAFLIHFPHKRIFAHEQYENFMAQWIFTQLICFQTQILDSFISLNFFPIFNNKVTFSVCN